jgi:hypothetical protein
MQEKLKRGKFKNVSEREFNTLRATKAHVESLILEEMKIIITTCMASNMSRLEHLTFERVIIDEAA